MKRNLSELNPLVNDVLAFSFGGLLSPTKWENDLTKLNEDNLNSLSNSIIELQNKSATHSEGSKEVFTLMTDHLAGWTPDTDVIGAEIFNDYVNNKALAMYGHAQGENTEAGYEYEESEYQGGNKASKITGRGSHVEGLGTFSFGDYQHVQGKYNELITMENSYGDIIPSTQYAHIVGGGTESAPANIHTLTWSGDAWYAGNMEVDKDLHVAENAEVGGDATIDYQLIVNGDTTLNSVLDAYGVSTIHNTLTVTDKATLEDKLEVKGVTTLKNNLTVSDGKSTTLGGTLTVKQEATLKNKLEVVGDVSIGDDENVSSLGVNGDITVDGGADIGKNVTVGGTLYVAGAATFSQNVGVATSLDVGTIAIIGTSIEVGEEDSTNLATCVETLHGSSSIEGNLSVGNDATIANDATIGGSATIGKTDYSSSTDVKGSLNISVASDKSFSTTKDGISINNLGVTVNDADIVIFKDKAKVVSLVDLLGDSEDASSTMSVHGVKNYVDELVEKTKNDLLGSETLQDSYDTILEIAGWLNNHESKTVTDILTTLSALEAADAKINGTIETTKTELNSLIQTNAQGISTLNSTVTELSSSTSKRLGDIDSKLASIGPTVEELVGKSDSWDEAYAKVAIFDSMSPEDLEKVVKAATLVSTYDNIIRELQGKIAELENLISCGTSEPDENTKSAYYVRYEEDSDEI